MSADMTDANMAAIIECAQYVLYWERQAIDVQRNQLSDNFARLVRALQLRKGRIVVVGMGKSGHIARKFVATLVSTGTLAIFLHPSEAHHGDIGMIGHDDIILCLSHSGATRDVLSLVDLLKQRGFLIIALTGHPDSPLALSADIHYPVVVPREACAWDIVPTASTTAVMAVCDAIAVVLARSVGFEKVDFFARHPHGFIGQRLAMTAKQVMRRPQTGMPLVYENDLLRAVLPSMSAAGLGVVVVCSLSTDRVVGILTDGDLRRALEKFGEKALYMPMSSIMTVSPVTVSEDTLVHTLLSCMEDKKITHILVLSHENRALGIIHIHDLLPLAGV